MKLPLCQSNILLVSLTTEWKCIFSLWNWASSICYVAVWKEQTQSHAHKIHTFVHEKILLNFARNAIAVLVLVSVFPTAVQLPSCSWWRLTHFCNGMMSTVFALDKTKKCFMRVKAGVVGGTKSLTGKQEIPAANLVLHNLFVSFSVGHWKYIIGVKIVVHGWV